MAARRPALPERLTPDEQELRAFEARERRADEARWARLLDSVDEPVDDAAAARLFAALGLDWTPGVAELDAEDVVR